MKVDLNHVLVSVDSVDDWRPRQDETRPKTGNRGGSDRKVLNQEGGDGSEETRWTEMLKDGPR